WATHFISNRTSNMAIATLATRVRASFGQTPHRPFEVSLVTSNRAGKRLIGRMRAFGSLFKALSKEPDFEYILADVFDYIKRFYTPRRRYSKLGYLSPMEFKDRAMLA
ncbi:hypothetical protein V8352_21830, partial [Roseovarius sp. D0-M9]